MSVAALNVNVTCLACDGTRPCAQCRALGRSLAAAGHRVFHSSRYAALRAAADGTYGFPALAVPLRPHERNIVDALRTLLPNARVAIATDEPGTLPPDLPEHFVAFSLADFRAGRAPKHWLDDSFAGARTTRRLRTLSSSRRDAQLDIGALLEDELAWHRASGAGFALAILLVWAAAPRTAPALALRSAIRATDAAADLGDGFAVILSGANAEQAAAISKRLAGSLASHHDHHAEHAVRCGIAVCPDDGDSAKALLDKARERAASKRKARRATSKQKSR